MSHPVQPGVPQPCQQARCLCHSATDASEDLVASHHIRRPLPRFLTRTSPSGPGAESEVSVPDGVRAGRITMVADPVTKKAACLRPLADDGRWTMAYTATASCPVVRAVSVSGEETLLLDTPPVAAL